MLCVNRGFDVADFEQSNLINLDLISDQLPMPGKNGKKINKREIFTDYVEWRSKEIPIWNNFKTIYPQYTIFISLQMQKLLNNKVYVYPKIINEENTCYYLIIEYLTLFKNEMIFIKSIFDQYCERLNEFFPHSDAIIYNGGRDVITNIDIKLKDENRRAKLYENIDIISSLTYEKDQSAGIIYLAKYQDVEPIKADFDIEFINPYSMSEHRIIRKLLQIVSKGYCLVATVHDVYGIADKNKIESFLPNCYKIHFKQGRVWELSQGSSQIITSYYSRFQFVYKQGIYDNFDYQMYTIGCNASSISRLHNLLDSVREQDKGTMIVFSKNVNNEAIRLSNTSIPITPIDLCDEINIGLVNYITGIDGAILCDLSGNCYAIGVILDGNTQNEDSKETIAKGARHNSA